MPRPTRILFLDQGRASPGAALGHVRVRHALEAGMPAGTAMRFADVRPFTRAERLAIREVPGLERWSYGSVRWHLARGWVARNAIRGALASDPPDVVHIVTDQVSFLLGGTQRRVPCVLSLDSTTVDWVRLIHGLPADAPLPPELRPLARLERRALERAPLSIAWTETVAGRLRALAPGARSATLHPGLDLEALRPRPGDRPAGGPVRVLFVGGRWEAKGGPDLIAALEPELGRGVTLDVVTPETLAPRDGVTVHSGAPGSAGVAELFARADVFCLPTATDAVPWVVLEAMASGVPVVSTTVGSIPEMIGPDAGLVVEPRDPEGLRAALGTLFDDRARRAEMGQAARARAEAVYDARRNAPALLELLAGVAADR